MMIYLFARDVGALTTMVGAHVYRPAGPQWHGPGSHEP